MVEFQNKLLLKAQKYKNYNSNFKIFDPIVTGGARGDFENLPVTSNRKTWLLCSASMAVLYHLSFKYGTSLCGLATELLKFTYERPKQTFFN